MEGLRKIRYERSFPPPPSAPANPVQLQSRQFRTMKTCYRLILITQDHKKKKKKKNQVSEVGMRIMYSYVFFYR